MTILSGSVLGTLYRWWTLSAVFGLLRRCWAFVRRAAGESRIFRAMFGPSKLDGLWSASLFARMLRAVINALVAVCRWIAKGVRDSAICSWLAPAVASSRILKLETLFGLFCCVMFIVPHSYWNNLYAVIAAVAFLALYLLLCGFGKRELFYPDALGLGLALFALSCLLSMLFSPDRTDSLRILLFFFAAFLFCWIVAGMCRTPASLRRLLGFFYVSLLIVCIMGIAQRALGLVSVNASYTDASLNRGVPGRIYSSLDNPNNLSGFVQLFLPLAAAYAAGAKRGWQRALLALGLVFPLAALLMTYARAGWLSVMLAAAVFLYCCNKRLIPVLAVLALLCVPFLPASVLTRLSTIGSTRDTSTIHRLDIWTGVTNLLLDKGYWLTGIGLGPNAFKEVYPHYAVGIARTGAYHSQMLYLELFLEMGVLGFVSFMWAMLKYAGRIGRDIARSTDRSIRYVLIAVISTFSALALSSIVEYLWFYQRLIFAFFLFLGIAVAACNMAEGEKRLKNE